MITHWLIPVGGIDPRKVKLSYLHAVVSGWMEDDLDDHRAERKQWSLTPITQVDGVAAIHVVTLTESAYTVMASAAPAGEIRLGSQHGVVLGRPVVAGGVTVDDILDTPVERAHCVVFRTPTALRNKDCISPLLEPYRLVGSAVKRWNSLVADSARQLEHGVAPSEIWVSDLDGRNEVMKVHGITVSGFVGRMRFVCENDNAAQLFSRIWAFAEHAGIGAYTPHGLGCVAREDTWQPREPRRPARPRRAQARISA
ncbi:MAG: CRISPR system precrRNA processing endoribonuclease RAMP protein Cas6 [Gordonia sp. (in: high G+C Gram-positive bacteria)]